MKTKLLSMLTASIMLTAAVPMQPIQAADKAASNGIFGTLPEWVPQSFPDAMEFYNSHGKSYVSDNIICLVRPMLQYKEADYEFSISGSMTMINTPAGGDPKIYELETPKKPDPDDPAAVMAYEDICWKIGIDPDNYSFFESYSGCKTQYAFEVELFRVLKGHDLTVTWHEKDGDGYKTTETFTFENKWGTTVETDIYSWLPDCRSEFNARQQEDAMANDNYLAFLLQSNAGTPYEWTETVTGDKCLELAEVRDCSPFELMPRDGGIVNKIHLYKAVKDGNTTVSYDLMPLDTDGKSLKNKTAKCAVFDDAQAILLPGQMRVTLADYDSGKPLSYGGDTIPGISTNITFYEPEGPMSTGPILPLETNPSVHDNITFFGADSFSFDLDKNALPAGYSFPDDAAQMGYFNGTLLPKNGITLRRFDNGSADVVFKLKYTPSGDANSDGEFNVADMVHLQKWLLGSHNLRIADREKADFCHDGKLNVFDLIMMKRALINKNHGVVLPNIAVYPTTKDWFYISGEDFNMYSGPGTEYSVIDTIPDNRDWLYEYGYMKDNDDWIYTEYEGKHGWVRVNLDDGSKNITFSSFVYDKPVIYLYPETETDVHVELDLKDADLATTYPKYNNGWDVTASPDGTLLNKADGTHHKYLFWDAVNCNTKYDLSKGFCVAGSDTESFLKEKLTYMGLTEQEMNEFIVYWLPRMEHNKYNLISFQGDAYTNSAELNISPEPDSLLRIFMTYAPLNKAVDIEPQQLGTFERKGFTVVEWGGSEIS